MTIIIVVAVFAVIQSMFGVGLLVFGTPTLLLLGYPLEQALAALLPASLTVSLLQLWKGPEIDKQFLVQFTAWCLVPLATLLATVLTLHLQTSLNLLVAVALTSFVILRIVPGLDENARNWVSRHQRSWLLLTGVVHGLSNLGGGLLTILAASRYHQKELIRKHIALCYTCFAVIQLGVLAALSPNVFGWDQLAYAATSAIAFLVVGQRIFLRVSERFFDRLFTAFLASYAVLLASRATGLF